MAGRASRSIPAVRPVAARPHMPGYEEMLGRYAERGLLPWRWAEERLERAHNYWLSTTRPDGRPHAMPVWGVWLESAFLFSTGARSRKARNLAHDARCVIAPEYAGEAVIVEGVAAPLADRGLLDAFAAAYSAKYAWEVDPDQGPIYRVAPVIAFAFIEDESGGEHPGSHTRWSFPT